MKKLAMLFLTALFLQSCVYDDIDYNGATKEVFEGVLTDQSGNPLEGIKVSVFLSNGSDADIPGYDFTDSNGKFKFVFPGVSKFDSDQAYVALLVNQERYTEARDNRYSSYTIHNIKLDQMQSHKINFGTTALFETEEGTSLSINFVSQSGSTQRPAVNLLGMVDRNFIDYNESILDLYEYYFNQTDFTVAKNQTITLLYQPYNPDGAPAEIEEVDIAIGEGPVTYTLTY